MRPILLINGEWMRGAEITSAISYLAADAQALPRGVVNFVKNDTPSYTKEMAIGVMELKTRRSGRQVISVHFDEGQ